MSDRTSTRHTVPTHRLQFLLALVVGLSAGPPAFAAEPQLSMTDRGVLAVNWRGADLLKQPLLDVQRVVLEQRGTDGGAIWGRRYESADVDQPKLTVQPDKHRVDHEYPWGSVRLTASGGEAQVRFELTVVNATQNQAIADFRVRLFQLAFFDPLSGVGKGRVAQTLDRPFWLELGAAKGTLVLTCESFEVPLQFGIEPVAAGGVDHDRRARRYDIVALGGVPATDGPVLPPLGLPHIGPGEQRTFVFVLRYLPPDASVTDALRPYFEAYRASRGRPVDWPDRRPIGKLELPSHARYRTLDNPRGWFQSPRMDVRTDAGRAAFGEKMAALADEVIANAEQAGAQGVVVWNLAGSHIPPAQPLGDPRLLKQIAPEMDEVADDFFKRLTDAGLRTGLCIRPTQLYNSERRQRWTHGNGALAPDPDPFGQELAATVPPGQSPERIYPLAERLAAKIAYAKQRWGCEIFYIHFNGYWFNPAPQRQALWTLFDARTLRRLRQMHPDVLLIPQYAHRHWRTMHGPTVIAAQQKQTNKVLAELREYEDLDLEVPPPQPRYSLRGTEADRIAHTPTPRWLIGNRFELERERGLSGRRSPFTGPRHVLRQDYWAHAAPYVELRQHRLIREYVLTLDQHMSYTYDEADAMAADAIAFETTPSRVRTWLPAAFTTIDLDGAEIDRRRTQLQQAAAWGDILMWPVRTHPSEVRALTDAVSGKLQRTTTLAQQVGLIAEGQRPFLTPLSAIWAKGEPLNVGRIVADGPVPAGLNARVAYNADRTGALVMLAWSDGRAKTVALDATLEGIQMAKPHKHIYRLPSGAMAGQGQTISIDPDPVAGLNLLLIHATDTPANRPPAGTMLVASFDSGLAPDRGGGVRSDGPRGQAKRVAGQQGQAVRLTPGQQAAYNIVPGWHAGAAAFDLKVESAQDKPMKLVTLSHELDLDLSLAKRQGRAGLLLKTRDSPLAADPQDADERPERRVFAPLADGTSWQHVMLTWEIGQYHLYVNGKLVARTTGPARQPARDGSVNDPGLVLGDADGAGAARVDSLIVYDWAPQPDQVQTHRGPVGLKPLARKDQSRVNAWVWGKVPSDLHIAVDARGFVPWADVTDCVVRLYLKKANARQKVGEIKLGLYGGLAMGKLPHKPSKVMEATQNEAPDLDMGGGGDLGGIASQLDLAKSYILEIEPFQADDAPSRTIQFSADSKPDQTLRW